MGCMHTREGFTFIELLLVISVVSALFAIVITAVNPSRQFAMARNTERRSHVKSILEAVQQHSVDNDGAYLQGLDGAWRMIGSESGCSVVCGVAGMEQVTIYPSADSTLRQAQPGMNFGTLDQIEAYPWSPSWSRRAVVLFDLSIIPPEISVTAATLSLREKQAYGIDPSTVNVHRITDSWNETGVTWSNTASDFDAIPTDSQVLAYQPEGMYEWDSWNVVSDVQAFLAGTYENYGWMIKDNIENASQLYWYFHSKEESSPQEYRPSLLVEYAASTSEGGTTPDACLNLSAQLEPLYLSQIPFDPLVGGTARTHYAIRSVNGRFEVRACGSELDEDVVVRR
jgi:prepilin-type N-terminal cleavage/methylation domain-containing protein